MSRFKCSKGRNLLIATKNEKGKKNINKHKMLP